ncbi:MAG: hypothetical protein FJ125_16290 [Deltaproteobacteria bacterium]|nr:hypothetical protein [Deltaproteobacteria bacterium]
MECASHLFVIRRLRLVEEDGTLPEQDLVSACLEQLRRIVAMLTSMARRVRSRAAGEEFFDQPSGSGSATRTGEV